MNYQHAYHAGSVADVFKHCVLIQLLKTLHLKPSPFCYFETHGGNALYDLKDETAQKTLEYQSGIEVLFQKKEISHPAITDYLNIVKDLNSSSELRFYPGSSLFARHYLREQDDTILCELHPDIYKDLREYYKSDSQAHVHNRNGYEAMSALLPPQAKRGLVLIDPPFEATDEYQQLLKALTNAQTRWPTGIYVIWFPIKQYEIILNFYQSLQKLDFANILTAEFWTQQDSTDNRLQGSGLIIINPAWQFDNLLETVLPALSKELNLMEKGKHKVGWLKKTI